MSVSFRPVLLLGLASTFSLPPVFTFPQPTPLPASVRTAACNVKEPEHLPFSDRTNYEPVTRSLVAPDKGKLWNASGKVVWDTESFGFLDKNQAIDNVSQRVLDFPTSVKQDEVKLSGNCQKFGELLGLKDRFSPAFSVITP